MSKGQLSFIVKEEFVRRGDEICESQVRQQVEEGNHEKILAIDIETGAFELANDTMAATRQLYECMPDAQPWVVRSGYRAVHYFGARHSCLSLGEEKLNRPYISAQSLHENA